MLHGSETWGPIPELQLLHRNDCTMIHRIRGVKEIDESSSASLLQNFSIKDITSVLRSWPLGWYSHTVDNVLCQIDHNIPGLPALESKEGLGRHGLRRDIVKTDVSNCGLAVVDPQDRDNWKASVRHSLVLPAPQNGKRIWMDNQSSACWLLDNVRTSAGREMTRLF